MTVANGFTRRSRLSGARASATLTMCVVMAACGGGSTKGATTGSASAAKSSTASSSATPIGKAWAADVCGIVEQSSVGTIIGTPITSAATPPTQARLCEYSGTLPNGTKPVVLVSVHYYADRSEWDIRMGNLGVKEKDHIAGLGSDAFKSSDGIWVLLDDGRLVIADVAYGVSDESAKELALAKAILEHA